MTGSERVDALDSLDVCSDFGPFDRLAGQIAWSELTDLESNRVTRSKKGDSGFPSFYGRKVGEGRKTRAMDGEKIQPNAWDLASSTLQYRVLCRWSHAIRNLRF